MNPEGISAKVLPGNMAEKTDRQTGEVRNVLMERQYGNFWMLKDLRNTNNGKVILTNEVLIPQAQALKLPPLAQEGEVKNLSGDSVSIPDDWIRPSGLGEVTPCTLLLLSFKDLGYQMLSTWRAPFEEAFLNESKSISGSGSSPNVVELTVTEYNFLLLKLLRPIVTRAFKNSKSQEAGEYENTLLYFGRPNEFCDALRMHNSLTGYALLVDYEGRVRWMGSGEASEEEAQLLVNCTKELCEEQQQVERKRQQRDAKMVRQRAKDFFPSGAPRRQRR
jgi:ATPase complex subunit ATP10